MGRTEEEQMILEKKNTILEGLCFVSFCFSENESKHTVTI